MISSNPEEDGQPVAQRRTPSPGELFCPSCGSVTSAKETLCGECGVPISEDRRKLALATPPLFPRPAPSDEALEPEEFSSLKPLPALPTFFLVVGGGLVAIPAAFQGEIFGGLLVVWLWAPIIEEILKPGGIYLLLLKWPGSISNRLWAGISGACAGLAFGLVESLIYVTVYFSNPTQEEVLIRFTVPVTMHVVASSIFAMGITLRIPRSLKQGVSLPVSSWGFFLIAIVLHSSYNISVSVLWPLLDKG